MGYIGNVRPTIALVADDITDGAITAAKLAAGAVETDEIVDADNNTKVQVEEGADDNIIRFDTAGSERMIIDAGGSVGIGTTNPTRQMELKGSTDNGPLVIDTASGTHAGIWLKENGTDRWQIYSESSSGDLAFFNYGTSAVDMRVKSDGTLLIGAASQLTAAPFLEVHGSNSIVAIWNSTVAGSTQQQLHSFYRNGGVCGHIHVTGNSVSYATSSDYRLKENVTELVGAIDRIKQFKPYRFNFIDDGPSRVVDGFVAHEVSEIVPEAISGEKDAMRTEEYTITPAVKNETGNITTEAVMGEREVPDYQSIDQAKLVPLTIAALQEALAKIETLEAKVAALEG